MGRGAGVGKKRRKGGRSGEKMGESKREGRRKEWRERERSLLSTYQAIEIALRSSLIRDQIPLLEIGRWPHT